MPNYTPLTVSWVAHNNEVTYGYVANEKRFVITAVTDGYVLFDRGTRVEQFSTIQAARFTADQRAGLRGVTHRSDKMY